MSLCHMTILIFCNQFYFIVSLFSSPLLFTFSSLALHSFYLVAVAEVNSSGHFFLFRIVCVFAFLLSFVQLDLFG